MDNINIDDLTAPVFNVSGAANGTTYDVCTLPTHPNYAPSDALSGLDGTQPDSWTVPSAASGVGTYTYQAQASDLAGNSMRETRTTW